MNGEIIREVKLLISCRNTQEYIGTFIVKLMVMDLMVVIVVHGKK
jgi:hypothetical protein